MAVNTQNFLLQILSDFLRGRPTEEPSSGTDWSALQALAKRHSVEGVVCRQCAEIMPENVKKKFLSPYLNDVFISLEREKQTAELIRLLERENVPVVYVKGSVFRDFYPLPPLRSMGDVDIVIRHEDRERMDALLKKELGFRCYVDNHAVWTYWKDNFYAEIHDHMFYENLANKVDYISYFDQVWENCRNASVFGKESPEVFVPDEEFHFLYLMAHTAKHVVNNGSGFRAYLDIVLMIMACGDRMNWKSIREELEKLELLTFTETCFSCCEKWFGVEMPFRRKALSESLFAAITDKTFRDGIFGLENAENRPASAAKDIRRTGSRYTVGALKRGIKRLFPPYKDLQLVPWYSFIDGKPWLLPFVWVYRFFYCAGKKLKHSVKYLAEPFSKKKEVKKRQDFLKEWGL